MNLKCNLGKTSTEINDESALSELNDRVGVKPVDPITSDRLSYRTCRKISEVASVGPSVLTEASNDIQNHSNY